MASEASDRSGVWGAVFLSLMIGLPTAWNAFAVLFAPPKMDLNNPAIFETAFAMFAFWGFGLAIAVSVRHLTNSEQRSAIEARLLYTLGCAMCLLHIAVAFHVGFAWSLQAAWDHVEEQSGLGWGLYVNFLFAGVWVVEVVWSWVALDHYLNRPRWITWPIIGFMVFIMFNATVVFATDFLGSPKNFNRIFAAMIFIAVVGNLRKAARARKMPEPGGEPGSDDHVELASPHSPT